MNCLFCKLVNHEIPAKIIFEDENIIGFNDINPQAPNHVLFIPRAHISTTNDLDNTNAALIGQLVLAAKDHAKQLGIDSDGYRLVLNCNPKGGQEVYHIHLHLLGGRQMQWPPG